MQPPQGLLYQDPALMYQLGVVSSNAKLKATCWPPKVTPGIAELLGTNQAMGSAKANMVPVMDQEGKIYYCKNPAKG